MAFIARSMIERNGREEQTGRAPALLLGPVAIQWIA